MFGYEETIFVIPTKTLQIKMKEAETIQYENN